MCVSRWSKNTKQDNNEENKSSYYNLINTITGAKQNKNKNKKMPAKSRPTLNKNETLFVEIF